MMRRRCSSDVVKLINEPIPFNPRHYSKRISAHNKTINDARDWKIETATVEESQSVSFGAVGSYKVPIEHFNTKGTPNLK
jgi:hypothetical protein